MNTVVLEAILTTQFLIYCQQTMWLLCGLHV
jgi:hypothetical protein